MSVSCPIGSSPYEIQQGDTLSKISRRYNIPLSDLFLLNPGIEPENLKIGQIICLGVTSTPTPPCPSGNYYVVKKGDSVYTIALSFGLSADDIFYANPGLTDALQIGQILCIPSAPINTRIEISISKKLLSLYRNNRLSAQYPIATGRPDTPTPQGRFTVINKQVDPGGPYGTRWLGLSKKGYGIHGTNDPSSIGTAASNGCIRMYNQDIEKIFGIVTPGTPVEIFP